MSGLLLGRRVRELLVVAAAVASVVVGAAVSRVVLDAPEQEVTLG